MDRKSSFILYLFLLGLAIVSSLKDNLFSGDASASFSQGSSLGKLSFEEEYKLFEDELDRGIAKHSGKSRQKRYVFLNTESNVDVGFLIVIPVTVILPGMTNLFNVWRRKRSLPNVLYNVTDETSPYVQSQVERLSSYFDMIHIPETSCQLRTICELAADPSKYFPLSDVILTKIRDEHITHTYFGTSTNSTSSTTPTLFGLYSKAADDGSFFGEKICEKNYERSCKYSTDKLLNMPVMKFWNKVQSKLRLKFEDVSEFALKM